MYDTDLQYLENFSGIQQYPIKRMLLTKPFYDIILVYIYKKNNEYKRIEIGNSS